MNEVAFFMKSGPKTIKAILHPYEESLGEDYQGYLNHAIRVYLYSCILLLNRENRKMAITAAFHDLDIWINHTMDYLQGSAELAKAFIRKHDIDLLEDEITFIIKNHHRLTRIKGNMEAEAFRKADLIDLTGGLIHFNVPPSLIRENEIKYPRKGFTKSVLKKTLSYALKHPFQPFPMIRR